MKLKFDVENRFQPDPFVFEDEGKLYLYVTANEGVEAYSADNLFGVWKFEGIVTGFESGRDFWAPSVIKNDGIYYMYVSCENDGKIQYMHVAKSTSPLGPFKDEECLYKCFSIDSHMVKTDAGLFLWYAKNNIDCDMVGTRVFVDKFIDPYTPCYSPKEVIVPNFEEELFVHNGHEGNKDWFTIEGPFWFREGEWQYVMYSGGRYENDTYHVGYAVAKSDETDLTKVKFEKHTDNGKFDPVLIKNNFEEGTGHHSVIKYKGEYYAIYHGRDYGAIDDGYKEARTARICRLNVKDGIITAERYADKV